MKVRLYRGPASCRGYVDEFSLYFRYPKWMIEENRKKYGTSRLTRGCYIGCSEASDGSVIKCNWAEDDYNVSLGRKYPLEKMSQQFQQWAKQLEAAYNDAIKYNDEEHWEIWNHI